MADTISIKIEDQQVQQALNRALQATGDLTPAMKAIGEHLLRSTEENFRHERDPHGRPWKPLKVLSYQLGYTIRKKRKSHTKRGGLTKAFQRYLAGRKILTDSSQLRDSIKYSAGRMSVAIGTPKVYGAIHQFGGKAGRGKKVAIPPRPYLGVGSADRREILQIVRNHVQAAISE